MERICLPRNMSTKRLDMYLAIYLLKIRRERLRMAELNLKDGMIFQRWIINDLVGENGFIERSHAVYDQQQPWMRDIWDFLTATQEVLLEFLL